MEYDGIILMMLQKINKIYNYIMSNLSKGSPNIFYTNATMIVSQCWLVQGLAHTVLFQK